MRPMWPSGSNLAVPSRSPFASYATACKQASSKSSHSSSGAICCSLIKTSSRTRRHGALSVTQSPTTTRQEAITMNPAQGIEPCTAPPHPATMTRSPSFTEPSASPPSGNQWFQRTNALLVADGDDCPCECLPARASATPQELACPERLLRKTM